MANETSEMEINLDHALAARREKNKVSPTVIFKGQKFTLPVEIPYSMITKIETAEIVTPSTILSDIFDGGKKGQWERFLALDPTLNDVNDLFEAIYKKYGLNMADFLSSGQLSPDGGTV